ncbi:tetratricopeptide repeat protein [Acinetobacter brisouii]
MNLEEAKQKFKQAADLFEKNEFDQAILILEMLSYKIDPTIGNPHREVYAKVYALLGYLYEQLNEVEKAVIAYQHVPIEERKVYATAQAQLGDLYREHGKIEDAVAAYQRVPEEAREPYARAQFNLGGIYNEQGEISEAIAFLECVPQNQQKIYAQAKLNLGYLYEKQEKFNDAINAYKSISSEQSDLYAQALLSLGMLFHKQENLDKAIKTYLLISEDIQEKYAYAQYNLGLAYKKQNKLEEQVNAFQNIPKEIKDAYCRAQLNLGYLYQKQGKLDDAILAYKLINIDYDEFYVHAQWNLGVCYLEQKRYLEFLHQLNGITSIQEKYLAQVSYHLNLYRKITSKNLIEKLYPLEKKITALLNRLIIDQSEDQLIAHYTAPSIAYLMLDHKNQEHPSKLRLNPTDFMNDPTEGALINRLFSLKAQEKPNAQIEQHKSFIGCFTLHHDSLNQFRLYGKENQREASGVSLVLNRKQFFEEQSNFSFVNHNLTNLQEKSVGLDDEQPADFKLPLFRCIYFDLDSGLIHVAQREEWTFCREKGSCQDNDWSDYKDKIDQVNDSVRVLIAEIKVLIKQINPAENSDEAELIEEILLPLRYLIKHYAFKEEQECRTIYITQWNDLRIQLDPKLNRVYVDYQSILPAMEKIFLSVGALHHESALQYLGQTTDKTFIVKRSHNPFRT